MKASRRLYYFMFAVAVLVLLWILTIPDILPEDIRTAYLTYFNIIRAITIVVFGALTLELAASFITRRLKHLG